MIRRTNNWSCLAILFTIVSLGPIALADGQPKTGSFETTFAERSPFSDIRTIARRLAVRDKVTDYDLSAETFLVYVPEHYDPAKPMGLIVLANYKHSDTLPRKEVLAQLADANMGFIVLKGFPEAWWERAGLALDAAYNMQKQYNIDRKRLYVFGGAEPAFVAQRLGMNFPEVFSGTFTQQFLNFHAVRLSNGAYVPAQMARPDTTILAMDRLRPLVLAATQHSDQWDHMAKAYSQDGFRVKYIIVTLDQFHYPNYTTDWLPDVLKFMDACTANLRLPATQPAK